MTDYGKRLLAERWPGQELDTLRQALDGRRHRAVPGGVHRRRDADAAHRRRRRSRPAARERAASADELRRAYDQLLEELSALTRASLVHADLSPFNVLWWEDRCGSSTSRRRSTSSTTRTGFDMLHHDVTTMCQWFARRGLETDGEAVFAELLAEAF